MIRRQDPTHQIRTSQNPITAGCILERWGTTPTSVLLLYSGQTGVKDPILAVNYSSSSSPWANEINEMKSTITTLSVKRRHRALSKVQQDAQGNQRTLQAHPHNRLSSCVTGRTAVNLHNRGLHEKSATDAKIITLSPIHRTTWEKKVYICLTILLALRCTRWQKSKAS